MNAAKMMVEMLLGEAQVFGLVFGPNIPDHGYWVQGNTVKDMVGKIALGLGGTPAQQANTYINLLIQNGYELVTDDNNVVFVYGLKVPEISDKAAKMLGCTATTQVRHFQQMGGKPAVLTGKQAFGLDMTPDERAQLQAQKAQAKAQAKQKSTNLSPEEEDEFNRWMQRSGKSRAGLTMPGTASQTAASAAASPAPPGATSP